MTGIAQKIIANPEAFSIDMLTKGVQDGTVPAYIGVPLIQEKTMALKKSQAMQGGMQQQQPPIAQQVLADAAQATAPVGIPGLQSNLPVATGAAGGIIAFADGGEAEDDDDEENIAGMSEDEQQLFNMLHNRMASHDEYEEMAGLGALPAAQVAAREVKHEVSSKVGNEPRHTVSEGIKEVARKGHHPYENKVIAEAERQGVDPKLALHVLYKETGNLKDPASARSSAGAQGVMQLMPATARGLGVKDPMDAQQNIEGGVKYLAQLSRMFDDPKLVAAAYNAGPGNVRKYNGVPPFAETRNYVQGLAQGGAVPGFANGVYVDPMGGVYPGEEPSYEGGFPNPLKAAKDAYMGLGANAEFARIQAEKKKKEEDAARAAIKAATKQKADSSVYDREDMAAGPAAGAVPAPELPKTEEPATTNPMGDYIGDYASYLKDQRAENAKDKETNKYLALLQAGLGMMGGTSRYAGVNIGQGASQGVGAYLAGQKQASANDRAIQQGMLGLTRADLYNKMHLEDIKRKALADKNMDAYRQAQTAINELNARANQMKANVAGQRVQQDFNLKAEKAWKESDDYARIVKELSSGVKGKKDWANDSELVGKFNRERARYIKNNLSEIQGGGNVANVDELLKD
jgi:hypothetical protein